MRKTYVNKGMDDANFNNPNTYVVKDSLGRTSEVEIFEKFGAKGNANAEPIRGTYMQDIEEYLVDVGEDLTVIEDNYVDKVNGIVADANKDVVIKASDIDTSTAGFTIQESLDDINATKQDITDNALETTNKTVVGAINELEDENTIQDSQIQSLNNKFEELTSSAVLESENSTTVAMPTTLTPINMFDNKVTKTGFNPVLLDYKGTDDNNIVFKAVGDYVITFNLEARHTNASNTTITIEMYVDTVLYKTTSRTLTGDNGDAIGLNGSFTYTKLDDATPTNVYFQYKASQTNASSDYANVNVTLMAGAVVSIPNIDSDHVSVLNTGTKYDANTLSYALEDIGKKTINGKVFETGTAMSIDSFANRLTGYESGFTGARNVLLGSTGTNNNGLLIFDETDSYKIALDYDTVNEISMLELPNANIQTDSRVPNYGQVKAYSDRVTVNGNAQNADGDITTPIGGATSIDLWEEIPTTYTDINLFIKDTIDKYIAKYGNKQNIDIKMQIGDTSLVSSINDKIGESGAFVIPSTTRYDLHIETMLNSTSLQSSFNILTRVTFYEILPTGSNKFWSAYFDFDNTSGGIDVDTFTNEKGESGDAYTTLKEYQTMSIVNAGKFVEKVNNLTGSIKINFIGDSLTRGYDIVNGTDETYTDDIGGTKTTKVVATSMPERVITKLNEIHSAITWSMVNSGWSGDTAPGSANRWILDKGEDLTFIMLGTNDDSGNVIAQEYTQGIETQIRRRLRFGSAVALIMPIPRLDREEQGIRMFRNILKSLANTYNLPLLDGQEMLSQVDYTGYSDNTHLNQDGYDVLGNKIVSSLIYAQLFNEYPKIYDGSFVNRGDNNFGVVSVGSLFASANYPTFKKDDADIGLTTDPRGFVAGLEPGEKYYLGAYVEEPGMLVIPQFYTSDGAYTGYVQLLNNTQGVESIDNAYNYLNDNTMLNQESNPFNMYPRHVAPIYSDDLNYYIDKVYCRTGLINNNVNQKTLLHCAGKGWYLFEVINSTNVSISLHGLDFIKANTYWAITSQPPVAFD